MDTDGRSSGSGAGHARLRATLDSLIDPHLVVSRDPRSDGPGRRPPDRRRERRACDYLRATRTDLLGQAVRDRYPSVEASGLLAMSIEVLRTRAALVLDDTPFLNEVEGEQRWYDIRGVPMGDDELVVTVRDVTERHEAAARIAESEERYRLLAENAWDVIWTMGVDGSISYVSPSVERVRGITPEEAAAQTLDQIHPPESAALVGQYFARPVRGDGRGRRCRRSTTASGSTTARTARSCWANCR